MKVEQGAEYFKRESLSQVTGWNALPAHWMTTARQKLSNHCFYVEEQREE